MIAKDAFSPWDAAKQCGMYYVLFGLGALFVGALVTFMLDGWGSLTTLFAAQPVAMALAVYAATRTYDSRLAFGQESASWISLSLRYAAAIPIVVATAPLFFALLSGASSVPGGMWFSRLDLA